MDKNPLYKWGNIQNLEVSPQELDTKISQILYYIRITLRLCFNILRGITEISRILKTSQQILTVISVSVRVNESSLGVLEYLIIAIMLMGRHHTKS